MAASFKQCGRGSVFRFARLTAVFLFCFSSIALADDGLLEILRDNKTITPQQYRQLKEKEVSDAGPALTGRLMVDAAFYDADKTRLDNGSEIRALWLGVTGRVDARFGYKMEADLSSGTAVVKDAYLSYTHNAWRVRLGNFKEPFGMETLTSGKHTTFMERALPALFAPGRNIGLGVEHADSVLLSFGLFGQDAASNAGAGNEGYGLTARAAGLPYKDNDRLVHLGLAFSYRTPDAGGGIRYRSRPESHGTARRFIDTGTIADGKSRVLTGVEAAWRNGPFSLQGEYANARVQRRGGSDLSFNAGYLYAGFVFTGETKAYRERDGVFGTIKPSRPFSSSGTGAWEAALRVSYADLSHRDVTGGREDNVTVGLTWYPQAHVRLMAEYLTVRTDAAAGGGNVSIVQLRGQVDF